MKKSKSVEEKSVTDWKGVPFVGKTAAIMINDSEYTIFFGEPIFGPCPSGGAKITGPGFLGDASYPYQSDCHSYVTVDLKNGSFLKFVVTNKGLNLVQEMAFLPWKEE